MSMTLAPRRRPLFNRRGRSPRYRIVGVAAVFLVALSMAFTVGMRVGSNSPVHDISPKAMIAAIAP